MPESTDIRWFPLPGPLPKIGEKVLVAVGRSLRDEREVLIGCLITAAPLQPQWVVDGRMLLPDRTIFAWASRPEAFHA